jgi:hypothetical protein
MRYIRLAFLGLFPMAVLLLQDAPAHAVPANTKWLSLNSDEAQETPYQDAFNPSSDLSGQRVAFQTAADLVALPPECPGCLQQPDDTNGHSDIYVRDYIAAAGRTIRVSLNNDDDSGGNRPSANPSLSPFARFVAFDSMASNLVSGDTNTCGSFTETGECPDIFLRDRDPDSDGTYDEETNLGSTSRVSISDANFGAGNQQANSASINPVVTLDADYVAFQSEATNLVFSDGNGNSDIFVRDRTGSFPGSTNLISRHSCGDAANGGGEGNLNSRRPSIDYEGLWATFESDATNLIGTNSGCNNSCEANCDSNGVSDIYLRNRSAASTGRVSVANDGSEANGPSTGPAPVTWGGRFVAFASSATNLDGTDVNGTVSDIYVRDTCQGGPLGCTPSTKRISLDSDENQVDGDSTEPSMSRDGRYIAFGSMATNLVSGDTNLVSDIFIRDRDPDDDGVYDEANAYTVRASLTNNGGEANGASIDPAIGLVAGFEATVAFESVATDLVSGDANGTRDIFSRDANSDTDDVLDPFDNCPTVPNPAQTNSDADALGDAFEFCPTNPNTPQPGVDDDGDCVRNPVETACGSDPASVSSFPERVDGPFAAVDNDGDTLVDEALPGGAANFDCDGDGYKGSAENHVYSYLPQTNGDQKTCQEYDTSFPTQPRPSKRWPSDLRGDGISVNRVNVVDLASFTNPVRHLNQSPGDPNFHVRWDLVPGTAVGKHINVADMAALTTGASGFPPMLGVKAFSGPVCPWPP